MIGGVTQVDIYKKEAARTIKCNPEMRKMVPRHAISHFLYRIIKNIPSVLFFSTCLASTSSFMYVQSPTLYIALPVYVPLHFNFV